MEGGLCPHLHTLKEKNTARRVKPQVRNVPPGANLPTACVAEGRAMKPLVKAAIRYAVAQKVALPDEARLRASHERAGYWAKDENQGSSGLAVPEAGIDISHKRSRALTVEMMGQADRIVTLSGGVEGACPAALVETENWD